MDGEHVPRYVKRRCVGGFQRVMRDEVVIARNALSKNKQKRHIQRRRQTHRPLLSLHRPITPSILQSIAPPKPPRQRPTNINCDHTVRLERWTYPPKMAVRRKYRWMGKESGLLGDCKKWMLPKPLAEPKSNRTLGCFSKCLESGLWEERLPMLYIMDILLGEDATRRKRRS